MNRMIPHFRDMRIANKILLPLLLVVLALIAVVAPLASGYIGDRIESSAADSLRDNQRAVDLMIRAWETDLESTVAQLADEAAAMSHDSADHMRPALRADIDRGRLDYASLVYAEGAVVQEGLQPSAQVSTADTGFVRVQQDWALQTSTVGVRLDGSEIKAAGGRLLNKGLLTVLRELAGKEMLVALSVGSEVVGASAGHDVIMECNSCHASLGMAVGSAVTSHPSMTRADMLGTPYLLQHSPFRIRGQVEGVYTVMLPLDGVIAAQRDTRNMVFAAGALLFAIVLGLGALISRSITRPLERLAQASEDIAAGNLGARIEAHGNDEVGVLAKSMSTMTGSLAGQLQELGLLHQVSLATNSSLELEYVLETLLDSAVKVLQADSGSIMLLDESRQRLEVKAARGKDTGSLVYQSGSVLEGPAGWVVRNRRALLLPDDLHDSRDEGLVNLLRPDIASSVSVPIETRDAVLGVLNLNTLTSDHRFDRHTLTFATTLANHTAVAIDKARHHRQVNQLYSGLVRALSGAIDAKDRYTHGHSEMVSRYALLLGERIGFDSDELKGLETAAYLHDIGKIGVRDAVLTKPAMLTPVERQVVETHSLVGSQILEKIVFPWPVVEAVRHHHERWDGAGYPDRLSGEDIPLHARILAVADSFDAMTSHRPYRPARSAHEALGEVTLCAGTQFDPDVVAVFLERSDDVEDTLVASRLALPVTHGPQTGSAHVH
ncbi:MAG: HD domain-containing protein [Actinobacteria bacterium]|nr:HD domain-containing protein [Actinomycetota bacterium]